MAKQPFRPESDPKKIYWLKNFASKLNQYAARYGLTADEVNDMIACAKFFAFWMDYLNQEAEFHKKLTGYKNEMRDGVAPGAAAPLEPSAPDPGEIPATVKPGIFNRAFSLANRIKNHKDYTSDDGYDLGLEGPILEKPDLNNITPIINVRPGNGGHPQIVWTKGQMDGIDVYVDRGAGNWLFLATDTSPDYTDPSPLPAPGQSAFWQYRCIYRFDDEPVGQWSSVSGITVTG